MYFPKTLENVAFNKANLSINRLDVLKFIPVYCISEAAVVTS